MKQLRDLDEPGMRFYLNSLAGIIDPLLPAGTLFVLLVFDDPQLAQYVSNCDRANMVQALRECADRLESRQDIPR